MKENRLNYAPHSPRYVFINRFYFFTIFHVFVMFACCMKKMSDDDSDVDNFALLASLIGSPQDAPSTSSSSSDEVWGADPPEDEFATTDEEEGEEDDPSSDTEDEQRSHITEEEAGSGSSRDDRSDVSMRSPSPPPSKRAVDNMEGCDLIDCIAYHFKLIKGRSLFEQKQ